MQQPVRRQYVQRLRQAVAQPFQLAAEEGVVELKTGVILQHAQRFAGPVGGGVEDAGRVPAVLRLVQEQRLLQPDRRPLGGQHRSFQLLEAQAVSFERLPQHRTGFDERQEEVLAGDAQLLAEAAGQLAGADERFPRGRVGRRFLQRHRLIGQGGPAHPLRIDAGLDQQHPGAAFFFLNQSLQDVGRLHGRRTVVGRPVAGTFQRAGDRGGGVEHWSLVQFECAPQAGILPVRELRPAAE